MATTALALSRRATTLERDDDHVMSRPAIEMENVVCPLCDGAKHDAIVETPDLVTRLGGMFRVVRCHGCGLAYTNPRPTESSVGQFYPADYSPHEGHSRDDGVRGRLRRRLEQCVLRRDFGYPPQPAGATTAIAATLGRFWIRNSRRRAAWIPFRGGGRLLDFGCGAAQFLGRMKELGWSVEGVDASAAVAERVRRETGVRVHVGSLPHPDIEPCGFDVVTMWSSLEHVHRPREVVRAARDALEPGGLLVVSVPNIECWSARTFGQAWCGLDLPRHLVHFTPASLSELLRREGFVVQRIDHLGRDGWLRRSVARANELGVGASWFPTCRWKPVAMAIGKWTERSRQAECIVLQAERV